MPGYEQTLDVSLPLAGVAVTESFHGSRTVPGSCCMKNLVQVLIRILPGTQLGHVPPVLLLVHSCRVFSHWLTMPTRSMHGWPRNFLTSHDFFVWISETACSQHLWSLTWILYLQVPDDLFLQKHHRLFGKLSSILGLFQLYG